MERSAPQTATTLPEAFEVVKAMQRAGPGGGLPSPPGLWRRAGDQWLGNLDSAAARGNGACRRNPPSGDAECPAHPSALSDLGELRPPRARSWVQT